MNLRGSLFLSIATIGLILAAFYVPTFDNTKKEAVLIQSILSRLNRFHYSPQPIDDQFSHKVYDLYLERLDPGHRWLTQEDLAQLEPFKTDLDNEALDGEYPFFDLSIELLHKGIEKSQGYYREILANPFDFTKDETFELDGEKRPFAPNDEALKEDWRKALKYETMTQLDDLVKKQKEGKDEELADKSFEQLEADARAEVLKSFDDWYERLAKEKRSDQLSLYLNAITNIFDPHTGYFEPIEKQNFDIEMSRKLEGIGATLQTDGNFTKVASIVVGGPAWKQGDLKEDDKIMKVAQGLDGDWVDVTGLQINEVVSLIRGDKGTKVRLLVKKVDGSTEEIVIERDVVILEESLAKSLILHTSAKEKVGYIRLPRFYDDFSDPNGSSCSRDIAKEIDKLKAENVSGIILDLRNNPGGSLREAIRTSGLFIESGPVVQVKTKEQAAKVYRDTDEEVAWGGPLIVLVNNYSASASEIVAAALQDYGRAVIVGSNTFGKGTVQQFFDLDQFVPGYSELKPLGAIKMTIQKYYRIDGGSVQLKGVVPDIELPDSYMYLKTAEKDYDYAMEWTEIEPVEGYTQKVYDVKNRVKDLQANSKKRIKKSEPYLKILENADRLKDRKENSSYSLNLATFQADQESWEKTSEAFEKFFENDVVFGVQNTAQDLEYIQLDEGRKARNDDWIKNVKRDVALQETLHILQDLMEMN